MQADRRNIAKGPLVSVVTPVYNGAKYLPDCIESVLAQSYANWEYVIVNNCSKDQSPDIATAYAQKDKRIKVLHNEQLLPMVQNWNHAVRQISDRSRYCKIVHADDVLFPQCIEKMVSVAESHPSAGVVGSYVLEGTRVKCDGLPYPSPVTSGAAICRSTLNRRYYLFGSPTSLLIRSDLIRKRNPFYQDKYLQVVDQEVCYHLLQENDFGFVHEVLTYSRMHDSSLTSAVTPLNRLVLEELTLLLEYGQHYLSSENYKRCLSDKMDAYYKFLGTSVLRKKKNGFWKFHQEGLKKIGLSLNKGRLAQTALIEMMRKLLILSAHPVRSAKNALKTAD